MIVSDASLAGARRAIGLALDEARRDGYLLARAEIARDLLAGRPVFDVLVGLMAEPRSTS